MRFLASPKPRPPRKSARPTGSSPRSFIPTSTRATSAPRSGSRRSGRQRSLSDPGKAPAVRRRRDRRIRRRKGAAQRQILPGVRGRRLRASLRQPVRLCGLRRGRRSVRGTPAAQSRTGAARAGRGTCTTCSTSIFSTPSTARPRQSPSPKAEPAGRHSRGRRGRSNPAPAGQGGAGPRRRRARRRARADCRQFASLLHPRGRRYSSRIAGHGEGGGAWRRGADPNADGQRHAEDPHALQHWRRPPPQGQGRQETRRRWRRTRQGESLMPAARRRTRRVPGELDAASSYDPRKEM